MIAIDNIFRDIPLLPSKDAIKQQALKKRTEVNKIYDNLKKGTLDLLIPEHFETHTAGPQLAPSKSNRRHLRMSFEYQKAVTNHNSVASFTPDILTVHKIKIPKGYTPIKAVLHYKLYTNDETYLYVNLKIAGKSLNINPLEEGQKTILNQALDSEHCYSCLNGELEINLKDISSSCLNCTNELPFSLFLRATKHYTFNLLIACELEDKPTTVTNWSLNTYNRLKTQYNRQQEEYELKFREQQQFNEHSLFDMI
ncbi:hypothetical protein FNB79_14840 [Formosa sediminum]|uniref:Uncharacterized protein n=1 Tax=Formosa sediminum TaxID=2594004 RepID=A0A516GUM2_9FLAO|nr:hypothetical protein [Formosa sediminum]QDO95195.1 hypothetical protein FNB79_14840 [Formosa sediminum]